MECMGLQNRKQDIAPVRFNQRLFASQLMFLFSLYFLFFNILLMITISINPQPWYQIFFKTIENKIKEYLTHLIQDIYKKNV